MKKGKVILNEAGEEIRLNKQQIKAAQFLENQIQNQFGAEVDLTTLTKIFEKVSEQKFYELKPSDYMPVRVGDGAWQEDILTYRSFDVSGDFENGLINTADDDGRLSKADTGVNAVTIPIAKWAKAISWSIIELNQSMQAGNWDSIEAREKSRKRNWDLGIQRVSFLGTSDRGRYPGLLTQATGSGADQIAVNTTVIPQPLKDMTTDEYNTFLENIIEAYRERAERTVHPTHMLVPESDWNGLASQFSPTYPLKTKAEALTDALKLLTGNPEFKVLPVAYAMAAHSGGALTKDRYALYRYDDESMRLFIPVDYTATVANTINGFNFQNAAYAQFTGLQVVRPKEMLYFEAP